MADQKPITSGIYLIRCTVNGKVYVGSAVNLNTRRGSHWWHLERNRHHSPHLQNAWNKYGEAAFSFEVIERCEADRLVEREQYHIDSLGAADPLRGFNIRLIAHSNRGVKRPTEAVERTARANRGRRVSEEGRAKMRAAKEGYRPSENNRAAVIAACTGRTKSPEEIAKLSASKRGKKRAPFSPEHRANLSASLMGNSRTKGRVLSAEHRRKLSVAGKGRKQSPEHVAKRFASKRGEAAGRPIQGKLFD